MTIQSSGTRDKLSEDGDLELSQDALRFGNGTGHGAGGPRLSGMELRDLGRWVRVLVFTDGLHLTDRTGHPVHLGVGASATATYGLFGMSGAAQTLELISLTKTWNALYCESWSRGDPVW